MGFRAMKYTMGLALLATLMMGCVEPVFDEITTEDPEAELAPLWIPTAEEMMLLSFLNDHEATTVERLDDDCAIRSDSADYLVEHRDGEDGLPLTADDDPFGTMEEVDDVHMVGPWTLERLVECAEYFGYGA